MLQDIQKDHSFLTLIPKKEKTIYFADFRPISLCNLVYKLISKFIALRLKPHLDSHISQEQFGFLKNRQIVDPIGITHEILHTVKTKNKCALILNLDLVKSFDIVNWSFIKLILLQIGVPLLGVNWIMGCLSSANFVVLVNGTPSNFFGASKSIRHRDDFKEPY